MVRRVSIVCFVLAPFALVGLSRGVAFAEVAGPCTLTVNGVDVRSAATPQTAIEVPFDSTVQVQAASSGAITSHRVALEIAGISWTADERSDSGTGWLGEVQVSDYATYGVGIYKVTGSSTGPGACSGTAFIEVTGKSPFTTVAGGTALGLGILGLALLAVSVGGAMSATTSGFRFPGFGLAGGVLGALGGLVLLQQFGAVYPSALVAIGTLAGGAIVGIGLPSLLRSVATRGRVAGTPAAPLAPGAH